MRGGSDLAPAIGRANRRRGEVEAVIDGERRVLCLTLGALAELETVFQADSLAGLAERFSSGRLKAADLTGIIAAGLRGGGNRFSDEDVSGMAVEGGVRLRLWLPLEGVPEAGDAVTVSIGCDKAFSTCRDRFANAANFRGFPHMPGSDFAYSYVKGESLHDGSVLYE